MHSPAGPAISTARPAALPELPLEWSFAGARSRGVIGYGSIDKSAPPHIRKVFALETLLTGVAPWPASDEAITLYKILAPLGDLTNDKFKDWRNRAIRLDAPDCLSAVYSREGEAWILLGNTSPGPRQVRLRISPGDLPVPLRSLGSVQQVEGGATTNLDALRAAGDGESVRISATGAVLLRIAR